MYYIHYIHTTQNTTLQVTIRSYSYNTITIYNYNYKLQLQRYKLQVLQAGSWNRGYVLCRELWRLGSQRRGSDWWGRGSAPFTNLPLQKDVIKLSWAFTSIFWKGESFYILKVRIEEGWVRQLCQSSSSRFSGVWSGSSFLSSSQRDLTKGSQKQAPRLRPLTKLCTTHLVRVRSILKH
jgi:hypothetical protein